ncbi:pseudouridine synthase [Carnobacterium gallinarum]|uniref:pseudouridine synthase n=1 Tax=Carnobacterium gallinarum TaxID=2749 RepID=UPI000557428E|nr:pseudouridine synthase [Carnobacterium gallinarum]
MRLDKLLSELGFGSRNQVKQLIKRKQVQVNGEIILSDGYNVDPQIQTLIVKGKQITYHSHRYYLLNKPAGVVSAVSDAENQTVIDLIAKEDQVEGLFPVGRLDRDTEGLLLITNNGQLAHQLLVPKKHVVKVYEASVNEEVTEEDVGTFASGIIFHGDIRCKPAELTLLEHRDGTSYVRLAISEGKFHQVKKMFLAVGKKVTYLKRIEMGPLKLDSELAVGSYRSLNAEELMRLAPYFK